MSVFAKALLLAADSSAFTFWLQCNCKLIAVQLVSYNLSTVLISLLYVCKSVYCLAFQLLPILMKPARADNRALTFLLIVSICTLLSCLYAERMASGCMAHGKQVLSIFLLLSRSVSIGNFVLFKHGNLS